MSASKKVEKTKQYNVTISKLIGAAFQRKKSTQKIMPHTGKVQDFRSCVLGSDYEYQPERCFYRNPQTPICG
jgi:hypothetical protein